LGESAGQRVTCTRTCVDNIVRPQEHAEKACEEEEDSEEDGQAVRVLPQRPVIDRTSHGATNLQAFIVKLRVKDSRLYAICVVVDHTI
jgi:hypothetical protein